MLGTPDILICESLGVVMVLIWSNGVDYAQYALKLVTLCAFRLSSR